MGEIGREEEKMWRPAIKEAIDGLRAEMRKSEAAMLEQFAERIERCEKLSVPAHLRCRDEEDDEQPLLNRNIDRYVAARLIFSVVPQKAATQTKATASASAQLARRE